MTNTDLEKLRAILNTKYLELQQGLGRRDGMAIERTADALDEVQFASVRELVTRTLEHDSHMLRDVRTALLRIDDGSYGACVECDEDISRKRLYAVPWTPLCIECQELADRSRQFGSWRQDTFLADAA